MIDRTHSANLVLDGLPLLEDYRTEGKGLTYHISGEHNQKADGPDADRDDVQSSFDHNGDSDTWVFALAPTSPTLTVEGPTVCNSEDYHFGRVICLDCPDDRYDPAFKPFLFRTHAREHLEKFPRHHITFWCFRHDHYVSGTEFTGRTIEHGGRRPKAGAPRGNLNALRTGKRVADSTIRKFFDELPDDQKPLAAKTLRRIAHRRNGV